MKENLKVEHYRNRDVIPTSLINSLWATTASGAFAVYDDAAANQDVYRLLYNWYTVDDPRELFPAGWDLRTKCI